ncbi:DgyrCDS13996 [Dimorphilus gyrociliatus]|uniref:Cysteine-rich protein 1 n=1 Tax=Dimorphilus gyrociliatus TaxID=2664684 RepID=A0A7I8WC97_9ANNE|nr:DgyrCDS13996 [Dimorphilus gyrociliatus]
MPKCPTCAKEVYFAVKLSEKLIMTQKKLREKDSETEKVTSMGKDFHRPCLKCLKCGKTLSSGSHAVHDDKPYCHKPCYAALFGPKGFGHGGAESHKY